MIQIRLVLSVLGLSALMFGCLSTSRPAAQDPGQAEVSGTQSTDSSQSLASDPQSLPLSVPELEPEPELRWSELTRLAREHQRRGEYDEAEQRLEQATAQVSALPPYHAGRRTVFGMRARFAESLAVRGELERADVLADQLIAEAEAEPTLGGRALVSLAMSVAERRFAASAAELQDTESVEPASQLSILRVALLTAQTGTADRLRLQLAVTVADLAYREGELDLARIAIDQAIVDARTLTPAQRDRSALLQIQRARIASAQNDYELAAADATRANQIFEETSAPQALRGIAEATLAEILAKQGEFERATLIVLGAKLLLEGEEPVTGHAARVILGALARVEAANGNRDSAQKYYAEALEVPDVNFPLDRLLRRELTAEAEALDASSSSIPLASPD